MLQCIRNSIVVLVCVSLVFWKADLSARESAGAPSTPDVITFSDPALQGFYPGFPMALGPIPRVNGSTSTHPLDMTLVCEKLGVPWAWVGPNYVLTFDSEIRPELRVSPVIENPNDPHNRARVERIGGHVRHDGTHGAYVSLIEKRSDFILVAREPSQDEIEQADKARVQMEVVPVARDAFVFIVNIGNPLESLTLEQLRKVYSGGITQWETLGLDAGDINPDSMYDPALGYVAPPQNTKSTPTEKSRIVAYVRNTNSGSQELLEKLVLNGLPSIKPVSETRIFMGMDPVIRTISNDPHGISYTVYYYEEFMYKSGAVKMLGVNGVKPSYETIENGTYPLATEVYAVIRKDEPEGSVAREFRDWVLSKEGQAAVAKSGYIQIDSGIQ